MDTPITVDLGRIAQDLQIRRVQVESVVQLLDEGNTVPFITRYRKERTGNLNEVAIREIQVRVGRLRELAERKETILKAIEAQGKLTDELAAAIRSADNPKRLEDLYLPFKPKKKTKASEARDKGLEPLALRIWTRDETLTDLTAAAQEFVSAEKGIESVEQVLEGVGHILAEAISEMASVRDGVRRVVWKTGKVVTTKAENVPDGEGLEYRDYFNYSEPIAHIPPHRVLAINRGDKEGPLKVKLEVSRPELEAALVGNLPLEGHPQKEAFHAAAVDALDRLLLPSMEREVRRDLTELAERHAVDVFARNLRSLLLQPPIPSQTVLAIDPGFRTGCKVAVLDHHGNLLEQAVIHPHPPQNRRHEAKLFLKDLVGKHRVGVVAIGNGTACRETEELVAEIIAEGTQFQEAAEAQAAGTAEAPSGTAADATPPPTESSPPDEQAVGAEAAHAEAAHAEATASAEPSAPAMETSPPATGAEFAPAEATAPTEEPAPAPAETVAVAEAEPAAAQAQGEDGESESPADAKESIHEVPVEALPPVSGGSSEGETEPGAEPQPSPEGSHPEAGHPPAASSADETATPSAEAHQGELVASTEGTGSATAPEPAHEPGPEAAPAAAEASPPPSPEQALSAVTTPAAAEAEGAPASPGVEHSEPESSAGAPQASEASAPAAESGQAPAAAETPATGDHGEGQGGEAAAAAPAPAPTPPSGKPSGGKQGPRPPKPKGPPPPPKPHPADPLLAQLAYVIVNEAGASVYSASPVGREEFPEFDASLRGTISIGRRLQDPLSELVKIEPQSIGVGLYQHDINSKQLKESLESVISSCVNFVGVDLNTASVPLLRHVSGLNQLTARRVVDFRKEKGPFRNREQLKEVEGVGPATFTQAAGFLKIGDGEHPLDRTWIHPESYEAAAKLLERLGFAPDVVRHKDQLPALHEKLAELDVATVARELEIGEPTLRDICEALARPERDPRDDLPKPIFKKGVLKLEDLAAGMELKGTVLNVVDFGAFVDIGLKDSGLVHISQLANRYIKSPHDVVSVGDVVTVWVMGVDQERKRVSLTMVKPGTERPRGGPGGGGGGGRRGAPEGRGGERRQAGPGPGGGNRPQRRDSILPPQPVGVPSGSAPQGPGGEGPPRRFEPRPGGGGPRPGGPGRGGPGGPRSPQGGPGGPGRFERAQAPRPPARPSKPAPPPPPLSKDALSGSVPLRTFGQLKQLWQARTEDPTDEAPPEGAPAPEASEAAPPPPGEPAPQEQGGGNPDQG